MDKTFINRALKQTTFNLAASDFQSTKYKNEIQHIFQMYYFPSFELSKTLDRVDKSRLNNLITELKRIDSGMFEKMHNYSLKGIGPGEVTLYFLLNNAHLGGGSSRGVDLVDGSTPYEIKSVQVNQSENYAYNFKLGGTVPVSELILQFYDLAKHYKLSATKTEIKKSVLQQLAKLDPKAYNRINDKYAEMGYEYFKGHKTIFIHNKGPRMGMIQEIMQVRKEDIKAEVVTSGTIKPMIQF